MIGPVKFTTGHKYNARGHTYVDKNSMCMQILPMSLWV